MTTNEPGTLPTHDEPPRPPRPAWRHPAVLAIAAGIVGAGAAVTAITLLPSGSGASAASTAAAASSPATLEVSGTLTIPFIGASLLNAQARDTAVSTAGTPAVGDPCVTEGAFTDIAQGTAVTIGGPTGQLGVGALAAGTVQAQNGRNGGLAECQFAFSVTVRADQSEYTVTIGSRGTTAYTPLQVMSPIALTLGAAS